MKILYFTNQEEFENNKHEVIEAHFVAYKTPNDTYHIAKARYHLSNQTVSEDIFHRMIKETINDYRNDYDIPKYKCGDVLRWQRYENDEYHYSIIQMKHGGYYYFDSDMPVNREGNTLNTKVRTYAIDSNYLIKKATEKERQIFFKNYIPKYERGDILSYVHNDEVKQYFRIHSIVDGVYIFEQPSTLISELSFKIDNNPKFQKANFKETFYLPKFKPQPIQVTETGKTEPVETMEACLMKKEMEIWQKTYELYINLDSVRCPIGKIYENCDRAVKEFRKSMKGE